MPPSNWIPVSERLPEFNAPVLLHDTDSGTQVGWLEPEGWWWSDAENFRAVTHWQPLPDPPEKETA